MFRLFVNRVVGTLQVALNLKNANRTRLLLVTLLWPGRSSIAGGAGGYFGGALAPIDNNCTAHDIPNDHQLAKPPATNDEVDGWRHVRLDARSLTTDSGGAAIHRRCFMNCAHRWRHTDDHRRTLWRRPAEYEQALLDLNQEAERMRTLTEDLLQLAHRDAARQSAKFERVDLSTLLKDVVDSLRPLAEDKGLKIIDCVPEHGLMLMGDSDSLIRLFVNLLDNAIKYTEYGTVTVSAQTRGDDQLVVTVSDTGVGIAPEHLPHVFDRFYRVDESRSSKDGMGLGSIVRSIAHAHGGAVTVESKIGEGTSFIVCLAAG
jgi:signal transduction histidine kinase